MRDVGSSDAHETFIATGLVAPDFSAAGHSVDSGVGPGLLGPTDARGSNVHTRHHIHCPVVPNKRVGEAVSSVGVGKRNLCGGG